MSTHIVGGPRNIESHEDFHNYEESLHSTENEDRAGSGVSDTKDDANEPIISEEQVQEVCHMKIAIVGVLFISILGAVAIFLRSKISSQEQFEREFSNDAYKVLGSLGSAMERSLGALNTLSTTFIAIADASNQKFPFVRIKDYGVHVANSIESTGSIYTSLAPIVDFRERKSWENYASGKNSYLTKTIIESLKLQENWTQFYGPMPDRYNWTFRDVIYGDSGDIPYNVSQPGGLEISIPDWQVFPLVMKDYAAANYDWYSSTMSYSLTQAIQQKKAVLSATYMIPRPDDELATRENKLWCAFYADFIPPNENCLEPMATWMYPVINRYDLIDLQSTSATKIEVKAFIFANVYWKHLIRNVLPPNSKGIVVVFENSHFSVTEKRMIVDKFTYQIDGPNAKFLGGGDKHDPKFDGLKISRDLLSLNSYRSGESKYFGLSLLNDNNTYALHVYPSDDLKSQFETPEAIIFALSAAAFILAPFIVFIIYERRVSRQQKKIITTANQSHAIVSSLFPTGVREKLYPVEGDIKQTDSDQQKDEVYKPIAELYPDTTVLFADIAGFTAWSSARDPFQVFTLLEAVYSAFDELAARRRVFKVETVGDCYVAVAGLPEPLNDHSGIMARFAQDIIRRMTVVTSILGTSLGPGTSSLQIRVGLNSGPTTAGVLRGSKGRFQLFGDTVNTAARMESHSIPGRILCTQKTADILVASGKENWLEPRCGMVDAKGKGPMQCYWVKPRITKRSSLFSDPSYGDIEDDEVLESQSVNWMSELFESLVKEIIISRKPRNNAFSTNIIDYSTSNPRDEVSESILLQYSCNDNASNETGDAEPTEREAITSDDVELSEEIKSQIFEFVTCIAAKYRRNPFHNFHHASHVVMATRKLLNRVIQPTEQSMSSCIYKVLSDPLTQFAIVFSALIHDVDHPGVSNNQLVKEKSEIAMMYNNRSVAEQNSITQSWNLLLQPEFTEFRDAIMTNESDCKRFRQIIVNSVLATDLFDLDLKVIREKRWTRVFGNDDPNCNSMFGIENADDETNLRATIIIEHIIQASDVSHTMQHWHIYQEWNQRLFREMYASYIAGRSMKDPTIGWYDGELWFFDNYILPLANKLKTCGVFGVSCDELLDYANDNRSEWATKGRNIVAGYVTDIEAEILDRTDSSEIEIVFEDF